MSLVFGCEVGVCNAPAKHTVVEPNHRLLDEVVIDAFLFEVGAAVAQSRLKSFGYELDEVSNLGIFVLLLGFAEEQLVE